MTNYLENPHSKESSKKYTILIEPLINSNFLIRQPVAKDHPKIIQKIDYSKPFKTIVVLK